MARRSSEGNTPRDLFHLTDAFRAADKYFDVSRAEILRKLKAEGECEVVTVFEADDDGTAVAAELKLNIRCDSPLPTAWTMSVKLHRERIDGIDFEGVYTAADGTKQRGWHRHQWDHSRRSAKFRKVPIEGFDDRISTEDFLIRGFQELRILLNRHDHGTDAELPFA